MEWITQLPANFGGLTGLGVFIAGIGFAYSQFRSGSNKAKDELIATLKETATVEREKSARLAEEKITLIKSHQEQINELNKQLGMLKGQADANEKKMTEYLEILKGKNPEQEKFMKFLTEAAISSNQTTAEAKKYMVDTIAILGEIRNFMHGLNQNMEASIERDKRVDETHNL